MLDKFQWVRETIHPEPLGAAQSLGQLFVHFIIHISICGYQQAVSFKSVNASIELKFAL